MSIVRNSLLMITTTALTLVLNYFFNVALGWFLPTGEFGIYGVASSLITVLSIFISSGFVVSAAKFISEEKSVEAKARIFRSVLIGNLSLAAALSMIFLLIQKIFAIIDEKHTIIVYLIILILLMNALGSCYRGVLQGLLKFRRIALSSILGTVAKFTGIVLVLLGFGAAGAVAGFLISSVVAVIVLGISLNLSPRKVNTLDKRIFTFALPAYVGLIAVTFAQNIDLIALKLLTGSAMLAGIYQAALTIARVPYWVAGAFMGAVFPYISGTKSHAYAVKSLKYVALFVLIPSLAICASPDKFLMLIFPERYLEASQPLTVATLSLIFLTLNYVLMSILQAFGKPEIPAKVLTAGVFVEAVLLIYLIPKYGILGAPLSSFISMLLCSVLLLHSLRKMLRFKLAPSKILRVFVAALLPLFLTKIFSTSGPVFLLMLLAGATMYLFLLIFLKVVKKSEIDRILKSLLKAGRVDAE